MAVDLTLGWNLSSGTDAPQGHVSAADALVQSLRALGRVDMAHIASRMGVSEEDAALALGDAVFLDPCAMEWQTAEEYLSGDLYRKLEAARRADKATGGFARNVAAIKDALPPKLPPEAIYAPLGSPWIPEDVVSAFVAHLMGDSRCRCEVLHDPITGTWDLKGKGAYRSRPESWQVWGTKRMLALEIVDGTLNGRPIRVRDEKPCSHTKSGKKHVLNHDETLLAVERQRAIQREFDSWLWEDPRRKARLADLYNERYCGYRRRRFDGGVLDFPGMAAGVTLRPHQRDAAMRILLERDVLVAHDVGAGKTYTAIAAIMELRRMGISGKNLVVVPNGILGQWSSLFPEIYPEADVLVVTPRDFVPKRREAALRAMRDEDHDAILMAYSSFKLIAHSKEDELRLLDATIRELGDSASDPLRCTSAVRRELKACKKRREQLVEEARQEGEGITFGDLGVTRLFVDEAQNFKNLSLGGGRFRTSGFGRRGSAACRHIEIQLGY